MGTRTFARMLQRSIGPIHATALVAGIIIGASIFVQPSLITASVPSVWAVYAVWIVSGVLTLFGALIAAELSTAYPRAGGVYVFLREAFSPAIGFLWGWAMFWTMHTGIIAAIAVVFARYAAFFLPAGDTGQRLLAIVAVLALSWVNYRGVRQGSVLQTSLTVIKVAAIVAIVLIAFALGPRSPVAAPSPGVPPEVTSGSASAFAAALVAGLFAFGGWHMVTYAAEETRNPERTIHRALVAGVLIVTACYLALNAAYFHVLSPQAVATSTRVAADAASAVLGGRGAAIVSAIVVVSTFGALNGIILAGPRVYLAMACDGLLWRWAADIHPRYRSPHRAIALQAAWAVVLIATGSYRALFTRVIYTEWIFFALMAAGLLRLRGRPGYAPAAPVPGYPVVPILFIVSSLYIVVNQIVSEPLASLTGMLLVAAGWPVYLLWIRRPLPARPTHAD